MEEHEERIMNKSEETSQSFCHLTKIVKSKQARVI